MKILIQVHSLTGGGAERVAASWANGLSALGHQMTVMTNLKLPRTYATSPEVRLVQRDICSVNKGSVFEKLKAGVLNPVKAFLQLRRYLRHERPDVVINVLYLNQYALLLARLLSGVKVPVIMTDHNSYERPPGHGFKWRQWKNKFIDNRLFDRVTVLTGRDKKILSEKGFTNVDVLYNPLFLTPVESIPPKENIILACGRLDSWQVKGFDVLMKAWSIVGPEHPDWKLRVVGAGKPDTIEFLKGLAGEGTDNLEFAPYTPDIVNEYRRASIFALSSRYEGWGLVMVEAMSQGCAVVACDYLGRQREAITDGINGLICEPDNVNALAETLDRMISDTTLRERIQSCSPESVRQYTQDKTATGLEKIINTVSGK
ncbi:MAG: glycosyltransferase [Muribaculaceae bacterium]|nr:glycosyltransferase [Muribaculaceae bacterium]